MVLRMILVGLVAGLGLNVPAPSDFDSMTRSAHNWMNARLAEWKTMTTPDDDPYVIVVEPTPTAPLPAAPAPASDEAFASVLQDTIDAFAQDTLASARPELEQDLKSREALVDDLAESLAIDLPTQPDPVSSDDSVSSDELALEMPDSAPAPTLPPVEVAEVAPEVDVDQLFASVVDEMVIDFEQNVSTATLAQVEPAGDDDDQVAADNLETAQNLDAINSETLDKTAPTTGVENKPETRLTTAVRLTREAVFAWANLLHGPAMVTMAP